MTSYDFENMDLNLSVLKNSSVVSIYLYLLLMICSVTIYNRFIYLIYVVLFVKWLNNEGSIEDSIYKCNVTKYIYKNNIVSDINLINYINLLIIYTYVIPFTYVGYYVDYLFATLFLDFIVLSFFHKKYLYNNKISLKVYINENGIDKVEGLPEELNFELVSIDTKYEKRDNCIYFMGDSNLSNLHISHNNLFNVEIIK
jgi:hypothetical protein